MRYFVLFFVLSFSLAASAQTFPASFVGHWEGELQWFQTGKKEPQKVAMQLVIAPADTAGQFTWQIIYGAVQQDNRPYLLKPADTAKGHWLIDEKNGIVLDQYWLGSRFTGGFTVQSTTIVNTYYREGENLVAEFYSLSSKPLNTTGGSTEAVPPVSSYAAKGYQKAVLKKKQP